MVPMIYNEAEVFVQRWRGLEMENLPNQILERVELEERERSISRLARASSTYSE